MREKEAPSAAAGAATMVKFIIRYTTLAVIFAIAYRSGRADREATAHVEEPSFTDARMSASSFEASSTPPVDCPVIPPAVQIEERCPPILSAISSSFKIGMSGGQPGSGMYCPPQDIRLPNLHKHSGSYTMDKIFPHIHHASSMASVELIMTTQPTEKWNSVEEADGRRIKDTCTDVYLTRTGGRSNQPNKCVAVAKVPAGATSIVQNSHREGVSAKMTNQYQNDYSRDYSRLEEGVLLAPLLEKLDDLIAEFTLKLGPPLSADGVRRSTTVMVANEGVMDLLLNFVCSAKSSGMDISSFVVFVGREEYVPLVESMGIKAMYSAWLGTSSTPPPQ